MFFRYKFNQHKTVKELRKNQCLTVKELAQIIKVDPIVIKKIDNVKLKEVPETLKEKITPILRGDVLDKIPW